jgi:hypothetical protein
MPAIKIGILRGLSRPPKELSDLIYNSPDAQKMAKVAEVKRIPILPREGTH